MRLVNRRMEIMLEIGESCVKPIAEIDRDGWKVCLDYRIGQYKRFFLNPQIFGKNEIAYKTAL